MKTIKCTTWKTEQSGSGHVYARQLGVAYRHVTEYICGVLMQGQLWYGHKPGTLSRVGKIEVLVEIV